MVGQGLGDRYAVQQQLAKKAGRRTLLACDLETQALVVVKLLAFSSDFEWNDLKLFEREAETLKALSHPSIPEYLDYFELNADNFTGFALVQSYIAAKSLEAHLKAGRNFSEAEVQEIAKAVLEILIYLHSCQPPVIHRDLKPSNILLGDRSGNNVGKVYLVDFGSVQNLAAREGGTMTVVGTYGYMPPEQFGDRTVPASDLYSLGATLIYLVTGTHPADLPQVDLRIQFERAANISPAFANWLRQMTQPSLERRFASASVALQALEQPQTNNSALLFVQKPSGSKVLLAKTSERLDILLPSKGFDIGVVFLSLFALAWNAGIFSWTEAMLSAPFASLTLVFALFSLPFWGVGVGIVGLILYTLFGKVRLHLDWQRISLVYELFGLKYHRTRPAKRQDIDKLEYICHRYSNKSRIVIWAGAQRFELGSSDRLSKPELEWIAQELSQWLGLPIIKE